MKQKIETLIRDYGPVALALWFGIFALTFGGFGLAIGAGVEVESAAGSAGTWGAAYVATQLTKPLRIAACLVLTPFVARLVGRGKSLQTEAEAAAPDRSV